MKELTKCRILATIIVVGSFVMMFLDK